MGLNTDNLDDLKILSEIKASIPRGIVLYSTKSDDQYNPNDRQLEIYTYLDLPKIDNSLKGIAKLKILCRLSIMSGTLSVRTIQKTFGVE